MTDDLLRPNDDAMWAFLAWWFGACRHGLIEIGWTVPGEDRGIRHFKRFELEDEAVLSFGMALNERGCNIYVRASTIAPDAPAGRTTDRFVMEIPGGWGDLDTLAHVEAARKVVHLIRPNGRVVTGRVPNLRIHLYLLFDEVLLDVERSRTLNQGLARLWQSDSSVANPSRLMRLPGSIAWPMKPGRVAELTEFLLPQDDRPACYSVGFVEQQLRAAPPESAAKPDDWGPTSAGAGPQPTPVSGSPDTAGGAISPEAELLRKIRAGEQWHNNVLRLVAHMVGCGLSDAMILATAEGLTLPGWSVAQTRAEVVVMIEGARKRWMRSDPRPSVMQPPTEDDVEPIDIFSGYDQPAPILRAEHVPGPIWRYATDTAGRLGVDPTAVAVGALVTCGSVISDRWELQPKMHDKTWTENARLWAAIVGDPSILKSPVVRAVTGPLDRLEIAGRMEHRAKLVEYEERHAEWKKSGGTGEEPREPKVPRYLLENVTIEAMSEVLREDGEGRSFAPAGKLLARQDEISEFLANMDRYRAGGRGGGDRGAWLRAYNGGRFVIDRIGRGSFAVPNWSACFLGGIQPEVIRDIARESTDDGLLQRFIFVVPWGEEREGQDRAANETILEGYEGLVGVLSRTLPRTGLTGRDNVVILHRDAHRHRLAIDRLVKVLRLQRAGSPRMLSALGKWPGLFARLCLTFHLVELAGGSGQYPDVVSEATAGAVAGLMRDVLLPHLFRADGVMFSTPRTNEVQWIAGHILAHRLERLTWRALTQANKGWRAPEVRRDLEMALGGLVACGWLEPDPGLPGRATHCWTVNPRVHITFAEKAEQERAAREAVREAIQREGKERRSAN